MVLLMWIVSIVTASGVLILLYNILEYFMWDNSFTITLISIISIIVSLVVGGLFWGIKETYEVVDVKDSGFYNQEILIEDDDSTYLLKDISGEYEVGNEIKLSVIYVELMVIKLIKERINGNRRL